MRLLVLTADLPPDNWSGLGVSVAHGVGALARLGCAVDVLTSSPTAAEISGSALYRLRPDSFSASLPRPDCLHLHSLSLAGLALELRRRFDVPLVYTAHSLLEAELGEIAEASRWVLRQKDLFAKSDHVVFLSFAEQHLGTTQCPRLKARSSIHVHGLPHASQPENRPPVGGPPLLVCAGRFSPSKGTDVALAVMAALLAQHPRLHCAVAGGHADRGSYDATLVALEALYPGRMHIQGWLRAEALNALLARASLLLMPSRYEPFGMLALEAMRVGCPVLGADVAGLRNLLRPGSGGALVAGHSISAWTQQTEALLSDTSRLRSLSDAAPAFVMRHYSADGHAERLLATLYDVVAEYGWGAARVA